jgi:hypothetical protein
LKSGVFLSDRLTFLDISCSRLVWLQIGAERLADKYEALVRKDSEGLGVLSPSTLDGDAMKD